mmetsp:Transcript_19997/g.23151  ORF Transcript_19997/g.23151 Transcript_19997/m.23151 type:complete len:766 (+) Transcript_19997:108-2405(+)
MAKPQQQQKQQPKPWSVHRYLQRFSNEECMDNFFKSIEICNRMEQKVEKRVLEIEKRVLESSEDEDDNIDDGDGDDGGRIKKNGKSGKQQRKKWVANVMRQMNHMRNDKRNLVIRNGKSDKISLHTTVEQQKQTQQQNSTTSVKQANPQKEAVVNDDIEFDSSDDEANLINTSLSWQSQQGQRQRQGNSMIQINNSDNTKKRPLSNDHASTGTTCTIAMTTNHQKQIENNTNNNHMNGRTEKKARIENKQISASRESMAQQQNKTTAGNVVDKKNSDPSSNNDDQSQQRGQNSNNEKQTTTSTTESAGCVVEKEQQHKQVNQIDCANQQSSSTVPLQQHQVILSHTTPMAAPSQGTSSHRYPAIVDRNVKKKDDKMSEPSDDRESFITKTKCPNTLVKEYSSKSVINNDPNIAQVNNKSALGNESSSRAAVNKNTELTKENSSRATVNNSTEHTKENSSKAIVNNNTGLNKQPQLGETPKQQSSNGETTKQQSSKEIFNINTNVLQIKKRYAVGKKVVARRSHNKRWYEGTIHSYMTLEALDSRYGSIRMYNILFDTGAKDENIHEAFVMTPDEFKVCNDDSTWKNQVDRKCDKKTKDKFAKIRGWFVTRYTSHKVFSSPIEALAALDKIRKCKNSKVNTKQSQKHATEFTSPQNNKSDEKSTVDEHMANSNDKKSKENENENINGNLEDKSNNKNKGKNNNNSNNNSNSSSNNNNNGGNNRNGGSSNSKRRNRRRREKRKAKAAAMANSGITGDLDVAKSSAAS